MVFVRIKRISGKEYAYLVANSWTAKGPRQNVAKYLGRVVRAEKAKSEDLKAFLGLTGEPAVKEWVGKSSFREVATALMRLELSNHNISNGSGRREDNGLNIDIEKAEFIDDKSKPVVLALNDGFLCSYTAKRLLEYDAEADYSGYNLADSLTAAGLEVEKDIFITLFGKMQAAMGTKKKESAEPKDFYY